MKIVIGADEARRTLLRRPPLAETDLPPAIRSRTRAVFGADLSAEEVVERILADVREAGDAAVRRYGQAFDGVEHESLVVGPDERQAAYREVDAPLMEALHLAAGRIRAFHEAQRSHGPRDFSQGGVAMLVRPMERVGMYVPGTAVVYPSSVLMTAIPARVAGVRELYMASPAGPDGRVSPLKLVAADIAGVDGVFRASGAQAIAAFAYGTETIPRVDKICGPGNIFVTLAKRRVFGQVGIDSLYGPSETLVVADESADPALCAADLLAQAEHDELATAILLTPSESLAHAVAAEVSRQVSGLERCAVAGAAIEARGGIAVTDSVEEAVELANEFAPEHLCLLVADPSAWKGRVRHAGGLFLGGAAPESLGDYTAGPSHVMPSGGSARFSSPLSVFDFLKFTSVVETDASALAALGLAAAAIARAEGLTAHARAIEARLAQETKYPAAHHTAPEPSNPGTLELQSLGSKVPRSKGSRGGGAGGVTRLARPDLLAMEGYEPIEPTDVLAERLGIPPERIVKLDGNENPYGPSPRALHALAEADAYHIYPDPQQRKLRRALADYIGVGEEHIVAGSGSDEIIDLLLRAFLSPGDTVIDCPPTFGMYSFSTEVCGGRVVPVPRREDFSLDLPAIEAAAGRGASAKGGSAFGGKVLFVASPNNPTGNVLSQPELEALLSLDLLLVVDEAYVEFGGQSFVSLVPEQENLVALRTFSKWAGLAGLRVGFGVMPPAVAGLLMGIKPPYNVSVAAQVAALASLADEGVLRERVALLVAERARMQRALSKAPNLEPLPSEANFILCKVRDGDGRGLRDALARRGVFVRHFDTPRLRDYVRISVGLPEHTDALLRALQDIARLGQNRS